MSKDNLTADQIEKLVYAEEIMSQPDYGANRLKQEFVGKLFKSVYPGTISTLPKTYRGGES